MLREGDSAVLACDLPEYGLKRGDVGAIVLVHGKKGYEVEFMTLDGETLAVASVASSQVRPDTAARDRTRVKRRESIAPFLTRHSRRVAANSDEERMAARTMNPHFSSMIQNDLSASRASLRPVTAREPCNSPS